MFYSSMYRNDEAKIFGYTWSNVRKVPIEKYNLKVIFYHALNLPIKIIRLVKKE